MTRGPTPSDLPVRAGDRIAGRFELRGEAAHGGMGSVFRARDRRDGHDVAIKVLRDPDARGRARFAREAAILAELCHPNVVRYLGHGATPDGVHYLIMAWLDGTTLAHALAHRAPSLAEIIEIARQTCRALAALHARGVVHRDVKPSNLMLGADPPPVVTLVDLGVARRRDELDALTRTGALVGTTGYLAPEQVWAASVVDARADLFALGCVLYLALTGTPAFAGDSALAIYAKLMLHHPPPVRALAPDVPPALDALVARLLARRPDDRPASALDVEHALAALAAGAATTPRVRAPLADVVTRSAAASAPACGVLVTGAAPDLAWTPPPGAPVTCVRFDGGLAIEVGGAREAGAREAGAREVRAKEVAMEVAIDLARAIAGAAPTARIAVAADAGDASWLDRGARLLGEAELAQRIAGGGEPRGLLAIDRRAAPGGEP